MDVRLFGQLEAANGGAALVVRGAKQRALLALLALHRGEPVSADRLIDVLWSDGRAANPANALQAQIGQLRRILGPGAIVTTEAGYALAVGPDDVDVVRFGQLVAEGRRLAEAGESARASAVLSEALGLRRGEPLAEFAYAGFADAQRAQLDELTLVAIEARAAADLVLGRHEQLAGALEAQCRQHPLRERLWELLILTLYRAGRQAEALRAYTEVRERLAGELGIDPGPALRELQAQILAQDPSLAAASPAPAPAAMAPEAAGNLPERLSSFVGRNAELERLREAVRSSRLVTLTGPGGTGKTRLAVEAAAALRTEYRDGAWLVELASVAAPDGVGPAVAGALGAVASALGSPQPPGPAVQLIVRHLAGRSLVVVLDNCEHVIGEAAALADVLAGAVPGLRLIATSREALGVPGEVLVPMGGLAIPAAVQLFADRARAVQPGFLADGPAGDVIEDICRRLDGLPLAVELAAARLRALPLATLADRLDDRFRLLIGGARTALPRQQTLRAVVDWSYDLLFEDERRLFARLATFTGGCELAAAEAICADDQVPAGEILDVLSRLVDKSLVTGPGAGGEARFTQLQTLWQYGRDRLEDSGETDAMRARHAAYYRQMATEAHDGLRGATGPVWRDRLTSELANLRAALNWYIATDDPDAALSLASGMAWLWFINGDFAEGARWLGDALGANGPRRAELEATARAWHGYCAGMSSSPVAGVVECQEAVAGLRASADRGRLAEAAAESAFLGKYFFFPVSRRQQGSYIRRWREFGRICAARNGALLRHVSTADSARDLDLLRQALGQPKLNYLGISYGTFLGATYANLFPHRVGRLVLDGNVPPQAWTNGGRPNPALSTYLRMGSDQAAAKALAAFLRTCGQRSTQACAFSAGSPAATTAKWDALLARLRRAPITLGGTAYTYAEIVSDVAYALAQVQPYTTPVTGGSSQGWPQTAQSLQQLWMARNGTASTRPGTLPAATATAGGQPYGGPEQDYAVQCNEAPSPPASAYAGLQRLVLRRSGVIGLVDLWTFDEPCATWPVHGQDTYNGPWNAPTSPILVIGDTTDPFLPLREAIAMTHQLGNARLLVVHGYGHTAFLNPSTCASTYMTAYFQTGALPPKGTVCRQNLPPFPPPSG